MITTRKALYQWDTGRIIEVFPLEDFRVDEIHIYNGTTPYALVLEIWVDSARTFARIPDTLLQSDNNIDIYAVMSNDYGEHTTEHLNLPVFRRTKPDDYVYTEEELLTWKKLDKKIDELAGKGFVLPPVTSKDDGKVLTVSNGLWTPKELPTYEGEFEIVPDLEGDTHLYTSKKYLKSDMVVKKVPFNEVDNTSGGTTITIG